MIAGSLPGGRIGGRTRYCLPCIEIHVEAQRSRDHIEAPGREALPVAFTRPEIAEILRDAEMVRVDPRR